MIDRLPLRHVLVIEDWPDLDQRKHELPPAGGSLNVVGNPPEWLSEHYDVTVTPAGKSDGRLWHVNPILERVVRKLEPGRAVDLGCGQGRDAVWLAANGWRVTAVDHLPSSIERGRALQARYAPAGDIEWIEGSVAEFQSLEADLLFMAYGPTSLLDPSQVAANSVLICGFAEAHHHATGKPKRTEDLVTPKLAEAWQGVFGEFEGRDRQSAFILRSPTGTSLLS